MMLGVWEKFARAAPGVRGMSSALDADVRSLFDALNGVLAKEGKYRAECETVAKRDEEVQQEDPSPQEG